MSTPEKARRFGVKLFLEGDAPGRDDLITLFHDWIREDRLKALLIDVVDYDHVHNGPGVMLMAHEGAWSVNDLGGEAGLSYDHRRPLSTQESAEKKLANAWWQALSAAVELEKAVPGLRFRTDWAEVRILDRLYAPNTLETAKAFEPVARALSQEILGADAMATPTADARRCFGMRLSAETSGTLEELRDRAAKLAGV